MIKPSDFIPKIACTACSACKYKKNYNNFIDAEVITIFVYFNVFIALLVMSFLQHSIKIGKSYDELSKMALDVAMQLNILPESVCTGIIDLYGLTIYELIKKLDPNPTEVCSFLIGDVCGDITNLLTEWNVTFPDIPKPEIKEIKLPKENSPTFKVLHLSDTHIDPHYIIGSDANCNEPLCCRNDRTNESTDEDIAGFWGHYNCDPPQHLFNSLLKHITETHTVMNQSRHLMLVVIYFVLYFYDGCVYVHRILTT